MLFRAMAVLLGLLPFLGIELALRLLGLGTPDWHDDPFLGFHSARPLFEKNAAGDRFEIARDRRVHFYPESFAVQKPTNEFRIFCIGDSTVQGNPWTIETSFTTWLELSLNVADSRRRWEVINCGGVSYASYRMVPILEEVLRYQPDLIIVHCSHNEFLEDRSYGHLKQVPRWLRPAQSCFAESRLFRCLRSAFRSETNPRGVTQVPLPPTADSRLRSLPDEVQAELDFRNGLEFYHRDPAWHRGVIAHFEFNVRRMCRLAHEARVPLLLMNPACNLRDSPPFKAEYRSGLTATQRNDIDRFWSQARAVDGKDSTTALDYLRQAVAIDDQHAGLRYELAKVLDDLGQWDAAKAEYLRAKDLDVCPLRILTSLNDIVVTVAREESVPLVDVRRVIEPLCRQGIPGSDWFADHVHPTIPGYQKIADALAEELVRQRIVRPDSDWTDRKQRLFAEHWDSLPPAYFVRAQETLMNLMLWAHGRVTRERPANEHGTP